MIATRTLSLATLLTALTAVGAAGQSTEVDYILIKRLPQTYVGQHPPELQDWVLPGGGCIAIVGPGVVGGNPQRHSERLEAVGYNNGPNGVKEWGMGDDQVIGNVNPTWTIETTAREAHSGAWCLHDSPNSMSSSDASATLNTVFDLSGVSEATLSFWHHWQGSYSSGGNQGIVEVRVNGGAWQTVDDYRYFGGFHGAYRYESLNLGAAVGNASVEIRFRMNASTGNGWTIDDILLLADGEALLSEGFESGSGDWTFGGTWGLIGDITDTPYLSGDAISEDRFGNTLATVDGDGTVTSNPIGLPSGTREGMGYSWVRAEYDGLVDGVMVYSSAMSYVPE